MDRKNGRWRWTTDTTVSVAAVVTALAALGVSVWQGWEARHFNRLQARPVVSITWGRNPDGPFIVQVRNMGTGPAFLQDYSIYVDGKTKKSYCDVLSAVGIGAPQSALSAPSTTLAPGITGHVMQSGYDELWLKVPPGRLTELLFQNMDRIDISVCYCSLYEECFEKRTGAGSPIKVNRCQSGPSFKLC